MSVICVNLTWTYGIAECLGFTRETWLMVHDVLTRASLPHVHDQQFLMEVRILQECLKACMGPT